MTNDPVATARGSDTRELHPKEKASKALELRSLISCD